MSQPLTKLKIVMCEALPWNSLAKVGSHHYAQILADMGHDIFWMSHDLHMPALMMGRHRQDAFPHRTVHRVGPQGNIHVWHPTAPLPFRRYRMFDNALVAKTNARAAARSIRNILAQTGFHKPDLLWLSQSYTSYLGLKAIQASRCFFRISDNAASFEEFPKTYKKLEAELIGRADYIGLTSPNLIELIPDAQKAKVLPCPNGCHAALFNIPRRASPGPRRIVFTGTLGPWVDFELIRQLAMRFDAYHFDFYGPISKYCAPIQGCSNISLHGPFDYAALPRILSQADAGIIPFKLADDVGRYANPLKAWEYLAAGLPVVATALPCFANEPMVSQAVNLEDFIAKLAALAWDGRLSDQCRKAAARYDWQRLTRKLLNQLIA